MNTSFPLMVTSRKDVPEHDATLCGVRGHLDAAACTAAAAAPDANISRRSVQCYNRGTDGVDVQWECKAHMREIQKFGWMQVTCEGYDHSRDEYVLVGSCGLKYYLERTVPGYDSSRTDVIVLILVLLICCCLCYLWYSSNQQNVPPHGVGYQPVINQPAAYPSAPPLAPNPLGNPPSYNLRFCSACQHPHTAYGDKSKPRDITSTGFAGTERR
ncbi:hypothetical protein MRX96_014071 [Rhipicephalus microplus]